MPEVDGGAKHLSPTHPASGPRWYVVQCRHGQDARALEHLERQGFECYRALYQRENMRRGCRQIARAPLFPGYLFIRLDRMHDSWQPVRSTRGVCRIVRFNDYPLPVADDLIERLRANTEAGLCKPYLVPGERVMITEGGFSGVNAIFMANDGEERVMLLLSILRRDQRVSFPNEIIRKVARR